MKTRLRGIAICAAFVLPLLAHHSVQAEYDTSKEITIQGRATWVEWMNPHAIVWLEVTNSDGTITPWQFELAPPNAMVRKGLRRDFVKDGDLVTVDCWQAKDGAKLAHASTFHLPDGRSIEFPRAWPGWTSILK